MPNSKFEDKVLKLLNSLDVRVAVIETKLDAIEKRRDLKLIATVSLISSSIAVVVPWALNQI